MKDNFAPSLAAVLAHEGGFVDDPHDPGGATNHGVTQTEYDHWRAEHGQCSRPVGTIDAGEVEAIYRGDYWNAVRGDELPSGVDNCTFDFAVASSPARAARFLQRAAGVTDDGVIGPATLSAVAAAPAAALIDRICDARLAYLQQLPTFARFGRGWAERVCEVRADSELMA